jgi:DNA-binding GntR family transcriptional regulator
MSIAQFARTKARSPRTKKSNFADDAAKTDAREKKGQSVSAGIGRLHPLRMGGMTLQERASRALREAIMAGHFAPGEPLTIRALAKAMGTSVMPIREGIQRLVAEGALELLSNRAVRVASITRVGFADLTVVRCNLEGLAAEMAATRITPEEIIVAERNTRRMKNAIVDGDLEDYTFCNREFHFTIYRASRSEHLIPLIEKLWLKIGPLLAIRYADAARAPSKRDDAQRRPWRRAQEIHSHVLEALRANDAKAAGEAIRSDILAAAEWYERNYAFPTFDPDAEEMEG